MTLNPHDPAARLEQCQIAPPDQALRDTTLAAARQAFAQPDEHLKARVLDAARDAWTPVLKPQPLRWRMPLLTLAASLVVAGIIVAFANARTAQNLAAWQPAAPRHQQAPSEWHTTPPGYVALAAADAKVRSLQALTTHRRHVLEQLLEGDHS